MTPRLDDIDLLVTDFDGVLTDDRVLVSDDGHEAVRCSRSDGLGCDLLRGAGLEMMILSTERNPVVSVRGAKLRVDVIQGSGDKEAALREVVAARGLDLDRVMYIGNDDNDAGALSIVGWPIVPADAHPDVVGLARHTTSAKGGEGVLRELADLLLGKREVT
ncbi:MAG: HAD hydrolase family protein [Acidimicrobiia bacterium]|nr:HAD hydrolase family protein [Acidimicrobiia bacterium]